MKSLWKCMVVLSIQLVYCICNRVELRFHYYSQCVERERECVDVERETMLVVSSRYYYGHNNI